MKLHLTNVDSPADHGLHEDIAMLLKLRFISVVAESKHLSTRPFSQLATRQWLRSQDKYDVAEPIYQEPRECLAATRPIRTENVTMAEALPPHPPGFDGGWSTR
jgi:hypothetical protein